MDGSPYSLGSDGAPLEQRPSTYLQRPPPSLGRPPDEGTVFPAGTGGKCVRSGPFSDITLNLGPVFRPSAVNVADKFRYSPHCLTRDFNPYIGEHYLRFNWTLWTVEESPDIVAFLSRLAGDQGQGHANYTLNGFGGHGGGHNFIGGSYGDSERTQQLLVLQTANRCILDSDFYSSPEEPLFFLHHGQIDRLWSIWQWQDIERRKDAAFGTLTLGNVPPSRQGTLDDIIDMGPLGESLPMRDVMSTIEGPYCYFYE